jgi:hypothetical protein
MGGTDGQNFTHQVLLTTETVGGGGLRKVSSALQIIEEFKTHNPVSNFHGQYSFGKAGQIRGFHDSLSLGGDHYHGADRAGRDGDDLTFAGGSDQ